MRVVEIQLRSGRRPKSFLVCATPDTQSTALAHDLQNRNSLTIAALDAAVKSVKQLRDAQLTFYKSRSDQGKDSLTTYQQEHLERLRRGCGAQVRIAQRLSLNRVALSIREQL